MCVYIPYIRLSLCKRISRLQDICQRRIVRSMRPLLLIVATRTSSTQECNSIHNMHIVQVYISSRRLWCNTLNISQPIHSSSNDLRWKDWIRVKDYIVTILHTGEHWRTLWTWTHHWHPLTQQPALPWAEGLVSDPASGSSLCAAWDPSADLTMAPCLWWFLMISMCFFLLNLYKDKDDKGKSWQVTVSCWEAGHLGSSRGHVNAAQTAEVKRRLLLVSRTSVLRWDGSDLQHANLHRNGGHHSKMSKICRHLGVFWKCPLRCYCRSV